MFNRCINIAAEFLLLCNFLVALSAEYLINDTFSKCKILCACMTLKSNKNWIFNLYLPARFDMIILWKDSQRTFRLAHFKHIYL